MLRRLIKDAQVLKLLDAIIEHGVPGEPPGKGLPIGNLTSQYFANLYLGELDHFVKDRMRAKFYIRYMDDFLVVGGHKRTLQRVLDEIRQYSADVLKLELKEKVTRIAPVCEGIPFLGFRIFPSVIRLQRVNLVRLRRGIRRAEAVHLKGKISEEKLAQAVGSRIAHARHADTTLTRQRMMEDFMRMA